MATRINLTFEEKNPRPIKMPLSLNKRFEIDEMTQLAKQQNKMDSSFSKMIEFERSSSSSIQSSSTTSTKCNCYRPFISSTPEKICCSLCPCENVIHQGIAENNMNISSVEKLESFMDQQDYSEINELDRTLVNSHSIFMEDTIIISNQNNDTESTLTDCYMEITATSE